MSKKPTIASLQQQISELTKALQHERADALNVKRRAEEDRSRMGDFYKVVIMREFLPALDNLERALKHMPDHKKDISRVSPWKQGIDGVIKQFEQCFEKLGIERIKTVGEHFDPKLHEAISVEGDSGGVEVVCEELQPGYKLGDDIIRHALVKVKKEKK